MCQKYTGKINWLAEHIKLDLSIVALNMARKCQSATLRDLKRLNNIMKKIK